MHRSVRVASLIAVAMVAGLVGWYVGGMIGVGFILIVNIADGGSAPAAYTVVLIASVLGALVTGIGAVGLARHSSSTGQ